MGFCVSGRERFVRNVCTGCNLEAVCRAGCDHLLHTKDACCVLPLTAPRTALPGLELLTCMHVLAATNKFTLPCRCVT